MDDAFVFAIDNNQRFRAVVNSQGWGSNDAMAVADGNW
jgi:hypothetical protein